jgi:hypothetical protein
MARPRKTAPKARVLVPEADERLRIEMEWDEKNPEFKHVWYSVDAASDVLKRRNASVVKDEDGVRIENGMSMLCAVPKDLWMAGRKRADDISVSQVRQIRNDDNSSFVKSPLRQYREPKSAIDPEDNE